MIISTILRAETFLGTTEPGQSFLPETRLHVMARTLVSSAQIVTGWHARSCAAVSKHSLILLSA